MDKFWEDPWSTKTKPVLVNPKVATKTCFITETNPFPTLFVLIIQLKMGSMFPPTASSSLPLPICYRSPSAIPSLGNCFPCGSIDLGKYVLYSYALRQRARWHTSLALSFGGHGTLPSYNSGNDDARRKPKTRTQRFVYARRDTEDGPLEIIPPEESTWYKFYVRNFYLTQDTKLAKAFRNRFRLPYAQYLQLVEGIRSNDLFDR